jgi:tetratricopeptide (TPR) repeat protein
MSRRNGLLRRYRFRIALLVLPALLAAPARALPPDADAWLRLETDGFTLFSNAGERVARNVAADLERLRATLAQLDPDLKLSSPSPTFLFVFRDAEALAPYRLVFEGKPVDVGGWFLSRPEANYVAIDADPRGDARAIVYHEYLHYVLRNNYPGLPLWLHEGMAQLYSTFQVSGHEAKIGLPLEEHAGWLRTNPLLPLDQLFALDVQSKDYHEGTRRGAFYAQSWALAHYLLLGGRREPTLRYLRTLARGEPTEEVQEAFRSAFGGELEAELLAYVRRGVFRHTVAPAGDAKEPGFRVSPLPRADLLAGLGLVLSFLDPSRRPEAEEHLKAALAADPGHGPALAAMGVLAELSGRPEEAGPWFERAAKAAPDDFLIQYRHGLSRLALAPDRAALRQAAEAFSRAVALRPDFGDAWARLGYALSFEAPLPAEALRAFETAHRLRPGDTSVAFNLMLIRLRTGKAKEAEALIDRIAAEGGPAEAERARAVWVEELRGAAERQLEQDDLEGALPLLEELAAKASGGQKADLESRLAEVREVLAYNRFGDRFDEAVRLAAEGREDAALKILEELAANAPTPGQAAQARRVLEELRRIRR